MDFAIDASLAHAPGDQLRDLRAEIDDEDEVVLHAVPLAESVAGRNGADQSGATGRRLRRPSFDELRHGHPLGPEIVTEFANAQLLPSSHRFVERRARAD